VQTKLSRRGQIAIPYPIRKKLGLREGDLLDVTIESDRIILTPRKRRAGYARVIKD
jgi:AbrB family looped-hinge helix DNA binding protein